MADRVQVILSSAEKERFAAEARRAGVSLSAWLRQAGHDRLRAESEQHRFTPRQLRAFFKRCRAAQTGREPDWEQHKRAIESSKRSGAADA